MENNHQMAQKNKSSRPQRQFSLYLACVGLAIVSLACANFGTGSDNVAISMHLPTLTRTPLPTLTPTANAAQAAAAIPSEPVTTDSFPNPSQADSPNTVTNSALAEAPAEANAFTTPSTLSTPATPTATPTPFPGTSGWSFNGINNLAGNSRKGMLLLTGELVNDTGAPQHEIDISGAFYNGQDEVAVDNLNLVSYVPVDPIPVNAHIPFELQVNGNQNIDRFDLYARSEPASDPIRQDFQFSGVEQWVSDAIGYCLRGLVDNQGPPVQEYLIVLATGYDEQGSVVNFGEYYVDVLPDSGAQSSPFELCLDPLGRQLSRHDLKAFGY